jgi:hypothetical protein
VNRPDDRLTVQDIEDHCEECDEVVTARRQASCEHTNYVDISTLDQRFPSRLCQDCGVVFQVRPC